MSNNFENVRIAIQELSELDCIVLKNIIQNTFTEKDIKIKCEACDKTLEINETSSYKYQSGVEVFVCKDCDSGDEDEDDICNKCGRTEKDCETELGLSTYNCQTLCPDCIPCDNCCEDDEDEDEDDDEDEGWHCCKCKQDFKESEVEHIEEIDDAVCKNCCIKYGFTA